MQMQMQNMQLGTSHMQNQGGMRSFNSMPQMATQQAMYGGLQRPLANPGISPLNQSGFSSSQPSMTNPNMNLWGATGGQFTNNNPTVSSNLWK